MTSQQPLLPRVTREAPTHTPVDAHEMTSPVVPPCMKLVRTVVVAGIAKKLYDESKKPQNRARIQQAVQQVKARSRRGH
jgi:hypothetical protein